MPPLPSSSRNENDVDQIECGIGNDSSQIIISQHEHNPDPEIRVPIMKADGNAPSSSSSSTVHCGGGSDEDAENDVEDDSPAISLEELIYGAASFHAVVKPVSITMVLAALAVIYINTEETKEQGEAALEQSYQVFSISDDQSAATSLGLSLVNSLIIVCVIGIMTFLMVLLYKYRCMKFLMGYMVLASTLLLGFLGGQMFMVAINKYQLAIDKISFYFTMYNFALVGTVAVFYQKGIPTYINQSYLVATSVIVAWQLSYFNDWMAWALLIMLALYDLFAVLTPCGPLKALVNLMQKDDAPAMPGLLYESQLPEGTTRPGRRNENKERNNDGNGQSQRSDSGEEESNGNGNDNEVDGAAAGGEGNSGNTGRIVDPRNTNSEKVENKLPSTTQKSRRKKSSSRNMTAETSSTQPVATSESETVSKISASVPENAGNTAKVPLAIAKVYKLPLVDPSALGCSSPTEYLQQQFSAQELRSDVEVMFPRGGGRIETIRNKKKEYRYVVYNKDGEIRRTLLVEENGKVMEEIKNDVEEDIKERSTIKLGLGDFIFYSVLVSKAAENGFTAFVACFLSILAGLGGTLVLLAVYHHALPALPISIFLAVIFFVLTIYCMEPWIQDMLQAPYYV